MGDPYAAQNAANKKLQAERLAREIQQKQQKAKELESKASGLNSRSAFGLAASAANDSNTAMAGLAANEKRRAEQAEQEAAQNRAEADKLAAQQQQLAAEADQIMRQAEDSST